MHCRIMVAIDDALHLSQIFGLHLSEPSLLLLEFVFYTVYQLLDASLDDEGLLELAPEKNFKWPTVADDMEIDNLDDFNEKRSEHQERLSKVNTVMAMEIIGEFLSNKATSRIIFLARKNL